jgi:hypothetical protein
VFWSLCYVVLGRVRQLAALRFRKPPDGSSGVTDTAAWERTGHSRACLRTLDEVGRTFNVTRERIRQIENQSLKKLQNLPAAQQLRDDAEIASGFALRRLGNRT